MDYFVFYGLSIISLIITIAAQAFISSTYKKYSLFENKSGMTGQEAARKILDENGLKDVYVVEVSGTLTDHYDPTRKVVRLSTDIYHNASVSAVSVAAHECGHAIQDKEGYTFMRIRSMLVPIVNFATKIGYLIFIIGLLASVLNLVWAGLILFATSLLFQIVTLPVEFDASKRGIQQLEKLRIVNDSELSKSKTVLTAAALTYVAGVLTTLIELFRLILIYGGRRRD